MKSEDDILSRLYVLIEELSSICQEYEISIHGKEAKKMSYFKRKKDEKTQLINEIELILEL